MDGEDYSIEHDLTQPWCVFLLKDVDSLSSTRQHLILIHETIEPSGNPPGPAHAHIYNVTISQERVNRNDQSMQPCDIFLGFETEKGQTTKKFRRNHQPLQNIRSHIAVMAVCYRSLNQMSATIKLLKYPKILEGAVVRHFAVNYIISGSKSHPFHITAGMKIPLPSTSNLRHHLGSQLPQKLNKKTLHPYTTFKHYASANSICLG